MSFANDGAQSTQQLYDVAHTDSLLDSLGGFVAHSSTRH